MHTEGGLSRISLGLCLKMSYIVEPVRSVDVCSCKRMAMDALKESVCAQLL